MNKTLIFLCLCGLWFLRQNLDETSRANYEQNMQDAMDLMHKLQTGLDVNVKFTGFEVFFCFFLDELCGKEWWRSDSEISFLRSGIPAHSISPPVPLKVSKHGA